MQCAMSTGRERGFEPLVGRRLERVGKSLSQFVKSESSNLWWDRSNAKA